MCLRDWGLLVVGFGGIIISASGYGALLISAVQRLFGKESAFRLTPRERIFLSLPIGLGLCSTLLLLAGLSGYLYPSIGWGLVVAGAALWGIINYQYLLRTPSGKTDRTPDFSIPNVLPMILWTGGALYTLLSHAFMPPHEWDELAYHLALAKLYTSFHKIIYIPYIVQSNWPLNTEMLFSWGLLLGSEVTSHLITWFMSIWTTYGLYLLSKNFFNTRVGRLSAALFLTIPLVKRLSGTGLIDISLPLYGTAALYCYCKHTQRPSLGWATLCGLASGFAAGSKLTGVAYIILFGILLVLELTVLKKNAREQMVRAIGVFIIMSLLIASPWYIRSYIFTGNPIWPFFFEIFGGKNWDQLGTENLLKNFEKTVTVSLPRNAWGLFSSLWYLFLFPHYLGGYHGGIGIVTLFLFILASLIVILPFWSSYELKLIRAISFLGLSFYIGWFFFLPHEIRYLFPTFPSIAVTAAFALDKIWKATRKSILGWTVMLVLFGGLFREFPWFETGQRHLVFSRVPVWTESQAREQFLKNRVDAFPAFRFINQNTPPNAIILLLPYENRGYYLDRNYIWGHPISQRIIPYERYDSPDALAQHLCSLGVTHILDNPNWLHTGLRFWAYSRELMLAIEKNYCEEIARWGNIVLYRMKGCASDENLRSQEYGSNK